VEMNQLYKQLTEKNIIIDRFQTQIKENQLELSKAKQKKSSSPSPSLKSPNR